MIYSISKAYRIRLLLWDEKWFGIDKVFDSLKINSRVMLIYWKRIQNNKIYYQLSNWKNLIIINNMILWSIQFNSHISQRIKEKHIYFMIQKKISTKSVYSPKRVYAGRKACGTVKFNQMQLHAAKAKHVFYFARELAQFHST